MKIMVLGANGMLGNAVVRILSEKKGLEVTGTIRSGEKRKLFIMVLTTMPAVLLLCLIWRVNLKKPMQGITIYLWPFLEKKWGSWVQIIL